MKKILFFSVPLLSVFIASPVLAQWGGSTLTTGNIYRSGNVGIGTSTTPTALLHISSNAGPYFKIERTASGNQNNVLEVAITSNPGTGVAVGSGSVSFIMSNPVSTADMVFMPTPTLAGMIIKNTGKIGAGTLNPSHKIHIHDGALKISGGVPGYGGPMVLFGSANTDGSGVEQWGIEYIPTTNSPRPGLNFWKPFGSPNPGNYYLFLADNGNIGIGTDNPGSFRLAVEGKIGAREIKVTLQNPWPDYVFEPDYTRMNLDEISCYISENKHLPGMPSADEIKNNNGIEVGDMQVKQMEKIEELYLLLIDMNEKLKTVIAENEQLKKSISSAGK